MANYEENNYEENEVELSPDFFESGTIVDVDLNKEMKKAYLEYSMSVIVGRALPDVRDGLKPVHRRILYTMHENGLTNDKKHRKCADTVGSVLGRYHPHGDASVYDALVRLAQDFTMRYPLVDGQGNFGSVDGDPAAAYRYTEARMSKISSEMLADIDKETVDFMPNFDDRLKEPTVLPSRYPNLLVNGSTGIAVGMATNIPPHNLGEVIDAVCCVIDNPEAELDDIMDYIKGPDFPTGGIIMGRAGIRAAYATGRGKIILRSKAEIVEGKKGYYKIVVTEIPYMVNKASMLIRIGELIREKRIDGISNFRDESDREGLRIVIEIKRDANPQVVLNQLYSYTQLQETVGVIMLALTNRGRVPKVMSLKEILEEYIRFQKEVIRRRTEYELKKAKSREHILQGLKIAIDFIDEVIAILRSSKTVAEGKERLISRFDLSEIQASEIVSMRLGQLTGLERAKIEDEIAALIIKIGDLEDILAKDSRILEIIKTELEKIKNKYSNPRLTEIESVSGEVDIEDLIPREEHVITYTNYGYIKRQAVDSYKIQRRNGRGISGLTRREEDIVTDMFVSNTHDNILFITNMGRMFKLKCYELPEGSRTARGSNIINLLPISGDEKIAAMINITEFSEDNFLVMTTASGLIKKTRLSLYKNVRKKGLIAIKLREGDSICAVKLTNGDDDLLVATKNGMAIRFNEQKLRPLSRNSSGVRAIKLRDDDAVVGFEVIKPGDSILTVSELGFGRRCEETEYRVQSRGGYGTKNYKMREDRGQVCGIRIVNDDQDIILINDEGVIIRVRAADMHDMSRYATGVRVMRLRDNAKVVSFTAVEHDEDEETEEIEQISKEDLEKEISQGAEEEASEPIEEEEEPDDDLVEEPEDAEDQLNEE